MTTRVQEAGITRVVPAVGRQHFCGGHGVLVVLLQEARALHHDFAVFGDANFHPVDGHAHRVGLHFVVGLQAHENRRLGRSIQLLEVDADGTVEREQVGADGFTGGVGHPHAAEAQRVAQRSVDDAVSQPVQQPVQHADALAVHQRRAHAPSHLHEGVKGAALQAAGVFHADHHAGEQAFENARRREVVGGPDFLQVDHHRGGALWAVHHVAAGQPLGVAEDVLSYPGQRHVGQHFFVCRELVEALAGGGAVQQRGVAVHHAFRVAGGATGEEHRGHVVGLATPNTRLEKAGVGAVVRLACSHQCVDAVQARFCVVAQPARVVEPDALQAWALLLQFQQFVDLFLVFDDGPGHLGVVDREGVLLCRRVLVQRHRHRAQRLCGQHRGVEARAVFADDDEVVTALHAGLGQAAGQVTYQQGQIGPGGGLPDAIDLLAQRRCGRALLCVVQHQTRKRLLHGEGLLVPCAAFWARL